jgi:hypothetical protein
MGSRQRSAITFTASRFNSDKIVVADKLFEPKAGGKMLSIRYEQDGTIYDIPRVQTPSMRIGQVWDNADPTKTYTASYTVALNFDQLRSADMENSAFDPATEPAPKAAQRRLVDVFEAFDTKVIKQIASQGFIKGKGGKAMTEEDVEGKFIQTVHWPDNPEYTLGIRAKINCKDTEYSARKVFICDQDNHDISYWKMDPSTSARVYKYEPAFESLEGEPVFNIDALRGRNRVIRAVLESNNAWIQQSISCSWKLINVQVEVGASAAYAQSAWVAEDDAPVTGSKRGREASAAAAGDMTDAEVNELMEDP